MYPGNTDLQGKQITMKNISKKNISPGRTDLKEKHLQEKCLQEKESPGNIFPRKVNTSLIYEDCRTPEKLKN